MAALHDPSAVNDFEPPVPTSLLDALPGLIGLLDQAGRVRYVSWRLAELTGCTPQVMLGQYWWDCPGWNPDDQTIAQLVADVAQAALGATVSHALSIQQSSGDRLVLDVSLAPWTTQDGSIGGLVLCASDRSEQRAGQAALDRSEARFRHVFEGAPDGIAMVDDQGRMALVNGAMERLFGYNRQEMSGQPIEMLIPSRYLPHHRSWRAAYMEAPTTRDMAGRKELYARRKDGSEFPAEIGLNPLRLPEGVFVLATVFDVTRRRADERILQKALAEKTALLNEVHHRVKNNLQVISSLLNLQSRHAPPEARNFLIESQNRVKAMALIHQLVYERHDYANVNLAQYLQRLGKLLHDSMAAQRGQIRIDTQCHGADLLIDLQRAIPCALIVNELVTNAIKHAFPDGRSGEVRIELKQDQDGGGRIIVADDGIGLPESVQLGEVSSLGFQLIPLLVDQLEGQLEVMRTTGTQFTLSFRPIAGDQE